LLYFGAEWFVGGASAVALALNVPQILVGLTVVAYGTSAPEIIVGIEAAGAGHGEVALGNVIGSNIANIGLILGIAALVRPARVDASLCRRELPVLLGTTALLPALLIDGQVSRIEAVALVVIAILYTGWMVRAALGTVTMRSVRRDAKAASEAADAAGGPAVSSMPRAVAAILGGLGFLLAGGNLFIDGAVAAARSLGVSERVVGLTIVAVGTSLPELVTSTIAARRGHSDIAVGNVIGSNIFNVLLCLGAAALARPLSATFDAFGANLGAFVLMTLVGAVFIRSARTISRAEGALAIALYLLFLGLTITHA
jgi:cation:H+ antiporter